MNVPMGKSPEEIQGQRLAEAFTNSCVVKAVLGGGAGFVMGGLFGVFMSSSSPNLGELGQQVSLKQAFKDMGKQSWSSAKNFGQIRGKHDMYNTAAAGCFSGAVLAYKGGPQAMATGCAGFAAFSFLVDGLFHRFGQLPDTPAKPLEPKMPAILQALEQADEQQKQQQQQQQQSAEQGFTVEKS